MSIWATRPRDVEKPIYHIRVKGSLDAKWADWFEGFVLTTRADGETLLSGAVPDQAALFGVLSKLNSLGLPLLLVAQVTCPCTSNGCAFHGQCAACAAHEAERRNVPYCFRPGSRWDKLWNDVK